MEVGLPFSLAAYLLVFSGTEFVNFWNKTMYSFPVWWQTLFLWALLNLVCKYGDFLNICPVSEGHMPLDCTFIIKYVIMSSTFKYLEWGSEMHPSLVTVDSAESRKSRQIKGTLVFSDFLQSHLFLFIQKQKNNLCHFKHLSIKYEMEKRPAFCSAS